MFEPDSKIDGCIRTEKVEVCEFCGVRTREEELINKYRRRGATYIIKGKAEVCGGCGARFFRPSMSVEELDQRISEDENSTLRPVYDLDELNLVAWGDGYKRKPSAGKGRARQNSNHSKQPAYITQSLVNCELCDGLTRWRKVQRRHSPHGVDYVVDGVDAEVCEKCGEKYFHARTLDDLDRRLKLNHK